MGPARKAGVRPRDTDKETSPGNSQDCGPHQKGGEAGRTLPWSLYKEQAPRTPGEQVSSLRSTVLTF